MVFGILKRDYKNDMAGDQELNIWLSVFQSRLQIRKMHSDIYLQHLLRSQ